MTYYWMRHDAVLYCLARTIPFDRITWEQGKGWRVR